MHLCNIRSHTCRRVRVDELNENIAYGAQRVCVRNKIVVNAKSILLVGKEILSGREGWIREVSDVSAQSNVREGETVRKTEDHWQGGASCHHIVAGTILDVASRGHHHKVKRHYCSKCVLIYCCILLI